MNETRLRIPPKRNVFWFNHYHVFYLRNFVFLHPPIIMMASYRGLLLRQQGFIELIKLTVKKARLVTITIEHCKIRTILSV